MYHTDIRKKYGRFVKNDKNGKQLFLVEKLEENLQFAKKKSKQKLI